MKKILYLAILILFIGLPVHADDYLYFADDLIVQGEQFGYVLGTGENQVIIYSTNPNLEVLEENFNGSAKDIIRFRTNNDQHLIMAHTMNEFIGTGYIDALARVAHGISNWTLNQISLLFRCQWKIDDSWISGSAKQWVDAGKPQPVRFTRGVLILGREGDMD